ncbi:MAG: hypothetical protein P8J32_08640, partial [bacterium]|nr:hypothetical protein [bacterium]
MFHTWRKQLAGITMCAVALLSFGLHTQAAAPPNIVTYQGRVLNNNGAPVSDASLTMKFWLYTASSGGTCVWSNSSADCDSNTPASTTGKSVTLTTGLFTQNLGDTGDSFAAIGDSVFADNSSIYMEVQIAGETLSPRKQLTAAPYALNAQRLDGIDSTGFLASDGDTGTGDYDLTGAELLGASALVFEGGSNNGTTTTFAFTDPTTNRTITFQDASGTVAYSTDILWEDGTNGVFENDEAVVIGADAAFTYGSGGIGDLQIGDELEVMGDGFIDNDLVIGASTSSTETLSNTGFSLGGDDLFVGGDAGIEGIVYADGGFAAGIGTTYTNGSISTTGSQDLELSIAGGDITFAQTTSLEIDSSEDLLFENKGTGHIIFDLQSTGDIVFKDNGVTELSWSDGGLLAFDPTSEGMSMAGTTIDLDADRDTGISAGVDDAITIELGGVTNSIEFTAPQVADAASSSPEAVAEFNLATPTDSTGTNLHAAVQIDLDIGNATGGTNTAIGLVIDALTGDAQVNELYGISVGNLTGTSATSEYALKIGSGWDAALHLNDSTTNQINIADGSKLAIRDDGGADIAIFQDVSAGANHIIGVDSNTGLLFDSNADTDNDITSLNNEDLKLMAGGTGELVFGTDGDTGVQIVAEAATDANHLLEITNNGFASSTDATNALDITYAVTNASGDGINITPAFTANGSDSYNAIAIAPFTPSVTGSGNMLHGISIGAPSGVDSDANIDGHAIIINSGWDNQLFFNDATSKVQLLNGGSLEFNDGTNSLMTLTDVGLAGSLSINTVTSPSILDLIAGNSIDTAAGNDVQINGGVNAGDPSGGNGGGVSITGGGGVGNGTSPRDGGALTLTGGNTTISTGAGGD